MPANSRWDLIRRLRVNGRTKPTSAYKICEFILDVNNFLHVLATFVAIFREVMYE